MQLPDAQIVAAAARDGGALALADTRSAEGGGDSFALDLEELCAYALDGGAPPELVAGLRFRMIGLADVAASRPHARQVVTDAQLLEAFGARGSIRGASLKLGISRAAVRKRLHTLGAKVPGFHLSPTATLSEARDHARNEPET